MIFPPLKGPVLKSGPDPLWDTSSEPELVEFPLLMIEAAVEDDTVVLLETTALPPVGRMRVPRASGGAESMKAMAGPAMTVLDDRSTTLVARGLSSLVMKIATGPLIPGGTTHCWNGKAIAVTEPPMIIWQERLYMRIGKEGEEKK